MGYLATRDRSRDVRWGTIASTALALFLIGLASFSRGDRLTSSAFARLVVRQLDGVEQRGTWHGATTDEKGDVVLFRPGLPEADLLREHVIAENRSRVQAALAAPLTTLYAGKTRKPLICLSLSHYRSDKVKTPAGQFYQTAAPDDRELSKQLQPYGQFWIVSDTPDRRLFLACLLPWLADALQWDLSVARHPRIGESRYFDVDTDIRPDDWVDGLSNGQERNFDYTVRVQRKRPKGIYTLGVLTAAPLPFSAVTVPVCLVSQSQTPRLTASPCC